MNRRQQVILISGLAGLLFWILDAVLDTLIFYSGSFWELLILNPPAHELYTRIVMMVVFLALGILVSRMFTRAEILEDRCQTLMEHFPNGAVLLFDQELRYLVAEGQGLEEADLDGRQLVGKTPQEVFPDHVNEIAPAYRAALEGESRVERIRYGKSIFEMHTLPIPDPDGQIRTGMMMTQDITAREHQLKALRESERRFREVLEKVNLVGVILDIEGNITYANQFLLDLTGWDRQEIFGENWFDTFLPADVKDQIQSEIFFNAVQKGKLKTHARSPILTRTGGERVIAWNNILLRSPEGEITGTASLGADITEQEANRQELEKIFLMSHDLICIADLDTYTFTKVNPAFQEVLGYTPEELLEKPFLEFVHPEDREATTAVVEEQLKQGEKVLRFTNRYRTAEGDYRWLDWVSHPIPEDGFTYAIARDITDQIERERELAAYREHLEDLVDSRTEELKKRVQEVELLNVQMVDLTRNLRRSNRELASANAELEAFVYSVSHDLRAPLRGISGFGHILAERHRENLNPEGQEYLDYIVQASSQMGVLIDDLLRYSRLGGKAIRRQEVDPQVIIQEVLQDLESKIRVSRAELSAEASSGPVRSNHTLLKQILLNLIDNALTYHEPSDAPRIEISCRVEDHSLHLSVSDQGIGIPEEHHEKIFNLFQRLHSAEEYPGTGIGLALVQKAVDLLEGEIDLESTSGKGSRFIVTLPLEGKHHG
jgi:PAS domain S-box-containing protein